MTLKSANRKNPSKSYRFVATSVIQEASVLYNALPLDTPDRAPVFWHEVVEKDPTHENDKEKIIAVLLNAKLVPFAWNVISLGTVSETSCHPREVFRPIIAGGAYAFILMHNHPSGDPMPSRADIQLTRRIQECAELLCLRFIDHVVVGKPAHNKTGYFSFKEAGQL